MTAEHFPKVVHRRYKAIEKHFCKSVSLDMGVLSLGESSESSSLSSEDSLP